MIEAYSSLYIVTTNIATLQFMGDGPGDPPDDDPPPPGALSTIDSDSVELSESSVLLGAGLGLDAVVSGGGGVGGSLQSSQNIQSIEQGTGDISGGGPFDPPDDDPPPSFVGLDVLG